MKTEMSYDDLLGVYAPLWDASRMIENMTNMLVDKYGAEKPAIEIFGTIAEKLESAKAPLKERIDTIVKENPDQFS